MPKNEDRNRIKKRIGHCECCGIGIPCILHLHHLRSGTKRSRGSNSGGYILLCANCHNILHHQIGWNEDFSDKYDRTETINIIKNVLSLYNYGSYGQLHLDL